MNDRQRSFVAGLVRGIGAAGEVEQPRIVVRRPRTELEAMRSDWVRVGRDLDNAIAREHGKAAGKDR